MSPTSYPRTVDTAESYVPLNIDGPVSPWSPFTPLCPVLPGGSLRTSGRARVTLYTLCSLHPLADPFAHASSSTPMNRPRPPPDRSGSVPKQAGKEHRLTS